MLKPFNKELREKIQEINACTNLYRLDKTKMNIVMQRLSSHLKEVERGNFETLKTDKLFYYLNNKWNIAKINVYSEYKNKVIRI
jgi:hypothetical protein